MSASAIRVEGLWKQYVIGGRERVKTTFREALMDNLLAPLRHMRRAGLEEPADNRFWALENVSLDVEPGEVVGIIGRNGAGKSTLLKILSRITAPTKGRIKINGRIASLLEVGTGFHPELTGRENIRLNGAILGMSGAEIAKKFDEIVAFAEVDKFLDTPVKHYSSGMYVRLAFAVAAHLEPEILIVDEVLAVGDAEFQKKCLGKMQDVAGRGRTVLFVSHNMAAVASLTSRAIILSKGGVVFDGPTSEAIHHYSRSSSTNGLPTRLSGTLELLIKVAQNDNSLTAEIRLYVQQEETIDHISIILASDSGIRIAIADLRQSLNLPRKLPAGTYVIQAEFGPLRLVEGVYDIGVYVASNNFSGNIYSLTQLTATPNGESLYPAQHRGFVDMNVEATLC